MKKTFAMPSMPSSEYVASICDQIYLSTPQGKHYNETVAIYEDKWKRGRPNKLQLRRRKLFRLSLEVHRILFPPMNPMIDFLMTKAKPITKNKGREIRMRYEQRTAK